MGGGFFPHGLPRVLVMLLAGGEGQRLHPLTSGRAKPGVRFGGIYRMIDFTLSNCVNSGLRRIHLLTQYASSSLTRHVRSTWGQRLSDDLGEFVNFVPPQRVFADRWYAGTGDAIFQNLFILQDERPDHVMILSGDHAYKMDYSWMLETHFNHDADLTVACIAVPREIATQLGVMRVDDEGRIVDFLEKPADPPAMPDNPQMALANMGVYAWKTESLVAEVSADARTNSGHDFGGDIIPSMIAEGKRVFAYPFRAAGEGGENYWRDIGTLDSYWQAQMDLVAPVPELNLYDATWPIHTHKPNLPPAKVVRGAEGRDAVIINSLLSAGCIVSGGEIRESVLAPGVCVDTGARVSQCILMDNVSVGAGAVLDRVIVDEGVQVPPGYRIGTDLDEDRKRFVVSEGGITVVPRRAVLD